MLIWSIFWNCFSGKWWRSWYVLSAIIVSLTMSRVAWSLQCSDLRTWHLSWEKWGDESPSCDPGPDHEDTRAAIRPASESSEPGVRCRQPRSEARAGLTWPLASLRLPLCINWALGPGGTGGWLPCGDTQGSQLRGTWCHLALWWGNDEGHLIIR